MQSWSDPNPSNATSAALSSQYKVDAAQIGAVVAAIMAARERNNQLNQQMQQNTNQEFTNAARTYTSNQNRDQNASQMANYMDAYQNPQYDELGGQYASFSGNQPTADQIYGGMTPEAQLAAQQFQAKQAQQQIENQIAQERVNAYMAKASAVGGNGDGGYPGTPETYGPDENGVMWRRGTGHQWFPMKMPRTPNDEPPADFPDAVTSDDAANLYSARIGLPPTAPMPSTAPEYPAQTIYPDEPTTQRSVASIPPPGTQSSAPPPDQVSQPTSKSGTTDNYNKAVKILQENGKPVTNANIQWVMQQIAGQ